MIRSIDSGKNHNKESTVMVQPAKLNYKRRCSVSQIATSRLGSGGTVLALLLG